MNSVFSYILVALFGLAVGSFLNAVIFRLKAGKSFLAGRSACPKCQHLLKASDLIPIFSFIGLAGRCRYCRQKISWQYPLVEAGLGLSFCLLFFYFSLSLEFFFYLIISSFLLVILVYDLKHHLILDKVTVPAIILAFIFNLILRVSLLDLILGGILGGGFFLAQYALSSGKWIGGGDIRLGVLMGFILGWHKLLAALFIAYFAGAIFSLFLIIFRKKKLKSRLPFGPFLVLATFVCLLLGDKIIAWYLAGHLVDWLLY